MPLCPWFSYVQEFRSHCAHCSESIEPKAWGLTSRPAARIAEASQAAGTCNSQHNCSSLVYMIAVDAVENVLKPAIDNAAAAAEAAKLPLPLAAGDRVLRLPLLY